MRERAVNAASEDRKVCSFVTCSAILALLDKDDDLSASHELLNTERIL